MSTTEYDHPLPVEAGLTTTGDMFPAILRILRILRLRKHIVLSTVYVFLLAGAVYYILAPRYYQSSANILIVDQNKDQLSMVGSQDSTGNTMATHRELVVSPIVIQRAIQQLEPRYRTDLQSLPPKEWVETIHDNLNAKITRKTNIIEVEYRSRKPESAAAVVRAIIQAYLDFVAENHKGTVGEFSALLTDKSEQIQAQLLTKQAALQTLRQQVGHLAVSSEDQVVEPMIQRALRLNEALLKAQEKRLVLQATLTSVEEAATKGENVAQHLMGLESTLGQQMLMASMGMSPEDLRVLGEQKKKLIATEQEMQGLTNVYGPNHPHMQQLRQQVQVLQQYVRTHAGAVQQSGELGKILSDQVVIDMLRQAFGQAQQIEQQLNASYELARAEAAQQSGELVQLRILERDVARTEALSDSLIENINNIDVSQIQAPIKATVTREPLPEEKPVSPRLRHVVLLSLMGGLLIGGLIVYVQDLLDDRFTSPEELSAQLNVPVLSIVRKLEPLPGEALASIHTYAQPNAVESEAFRTLRTALSLGGELCDRILVSSSEPSDGKTTISANLAVAFAQAGRRTLVIDADLRRPGFSAMLGLKGQQGVSDLLASEQPPETLAPALVQRSELEGLDILPVGLRRPNPAELLSGKAFVELLAWADSQYDRVLVDCPPVLAVSDAQIIGQLVDGAVLVVRPDKNHRRSVIRAVESFQDTGCRVLGVVANCVSTDTGQYSYGYGYGFGYGYGYGNGYSDGYGHDMEEDVQVLPSDTTDEALLDMHRHSPKRLDPENKIQPPPPPDQIIRPRRAA